MNDTTFLITGVDFVCVPAQDFEAMTAFYGETLGLPLVKRYGSRGDLSGRPSACRWSSATGAGAICLDPDGNPLSLHHRYAGSDTTATA